MCRAWKNKNGLAIGGLLIDTLVFNFLKSKKNLEEIEISTLCYDFFDFLSNQDNQQDYWLAPGSNSRVFRKDNFIPKAKKALRRCASAIEKDGQEIARSYWKRIFGRYFPTKVFTPQEIINRKFKDTEEFIEDRFPISIRDKLHINCRVAQDGFRTVLLRNLRILNTRYKLEFFIEYTSATAPYQLYWKVLNVGPVAENKDMIRGQIKADDGFETRIEHSSFQGKHIVEAYIVKNNFVIARDIISVNIDDF